MYNMYNMIKLASRVGRGSATSRRTGGKPGSGYTFRPGDYEVVILKGDVPHFIPLTDAARKAMRDGYKPEYKPLDPALRSFLFEDSAPKPAPAPAPPAPAPKSVEPVLESRNAVLFGRPGVKSGEPAPAVRSESRSSAKPDSEYIPRPSDFQEIIFRDGTTHYIPNSPAARKAMEAGYKPEFKRLDPAIANDVLHGKPAPAVRPESKSTYPNLGRWTPGLLGTGIGLGGGLIANHLLNSDDEPQSASKTVEPIPAPTTKPATPGL